MQRKDASQGSCVRLLSGYLRIPAGTLGTTPEGFVEPATRIERATCGLRISRNPTSDNLTPQETTKQHAPEVGTDGAELSCPGSSVVADQDDRSRAR
jgi:hypothetical protein